MNFWLFKSEPAAWSWDEQLAKGTDGEGWNGVRNYQARNFMRQMKVGDLGFFYHSQSEKSVVGVVSVIAESHQDSTTEDQRWDCVNIVAVEPLAQPVSLETIKTDGRLDNMILVQNSRLSVQPVTRDEWAIICGLAGASHLAISEN